MVTGNTSLATQEYPFHLLDNPSELQGEGTYFCKIRISSFRLKEIPEVWQNCDCQFGNRSVALRWVEDMLLCGRAISVHTYFPNTAR